MANRFVSVRMNNCRRRCPSARHRSEFACSISIASMHPGRTGDRAPRTAAGYPVQPPAKAVALVSVVLTEESAGPTSKTNEMVMAAITTEPVAE